MAEERAPLQPRLPGNRLHADIVGRGGGLHQVVERAEDRFARGARLLFAQWAVIGSGLGHGNAPDFMTHHVT